MGEAGQVAGAGLVVGQVQVAACHGLRPVRERLAAVGAQVAGPVLPDAAFAFGADAIVDRVRAHVAAGADHVCVQVIGSSGADEDIAALRALAPALLSA